MMENHDKPSAILLYPTEGRTDPQLQNPTNYVAAFIGSLAGFRDVSTAVTLRHSETHRNTYSTRVQRFARTRHTLVLADRSELKRLDNGSQNFKNKYQGYQHHKNTTIT